MKQVLMRGFTLALVFTGLSCGTRPCLDAVGADATYDVQVVAPYVEGGAFTFTLNGDSYAATVGSCSSSDGIGAGADLRFKGIGTMSNTAKTCEMVTAQAVSLPAPVSMISVSTNASALSQARGSNAFMYAVQDATIGSCVGTLVFGFYSGGGPGGVFGAPVEGKYPPAVFYRLFLPATDGCQPCNDNFVVRLSKV